MSIARTMNRRKAILALIYVGILIFAFGSTALIIGCIGGVEELAGEVAGIFQSRREGKYLVQFILIYTVPYAVIFVILCLTERGFQKQFRKIPMEDQQQLEQGYMRLHKKSPKGGGIVNGRIGAVFSQHYMLVRTAQHFFQESLICIDDVVWVYGVDAPFRIEDDKTGLSSPMMHFFWTVVVTADGRKHNFYMAQPSEFAAIFPNAIVGYGKAQKKRAKEELHNRTVRDEKYERQQRHTFWRRIVYTIFACVMLLAGFGVYGYYNSSYYDCMQLIKRADFYLETDSAYQAFRTYEKAWEQYHYKIALYREISAYETMLQHNLDWKKYDNAAVDCAEITKLYQRLYDEYVQDTKEKNLLMKGYLQSKAESLKPHIEQQFLNTARYYLKGTKPTRAYSFIMKNAAQYFDPIPESVLEEQQKIKDSIYVAEKCEYCDGVLRNKTFYNEAGKLTKSVWYNTSKMPYAACKISYDEDGNVTEVLYTDGGSILQKRETYHYREDGRLAQILREEIVTAFLAEDYPDVRFTYEEPGDIGNAIGADWKRRQSNYDENGIFQGDIVIYYDAQGKVVQEERYNENLELYASLGYTYEEKAGGSVVTERITYLDPLNGVPAEGCPVTYRTVTEYDTAGSKLSEKTGYEIAGTDGAAEFIVTAESRYTYDEQHQITMRQNSNGGCLKFVNEYDEMGNLLSQEQYAIDDRDDGQQETFLLKRKWQYQYDAKGAK